MPQMMPINWLLSLIFFIYIFMMFNMMNYFIFNYNFNNKNTNNFFKKINSLPAWKW
uniref:ATP synthase complex subunit 8 n=1 Tax=Thaumetopoea aff. pityocampa ENA TaxID=1201397 RepID=M5BEU7_9NEOP|nr:ATP8 [Thaumetopoea aff. pityocampa ENA]